MASNSLLTSKYFNRLYVDRLKAEKSQIVDEYSTLLTPELLNDLNNLVSGVDPNYIPFDSVSDSILLPNELINNGWIVPQKGNPNANDLTFYTENGNSIIFENASGKWDADYYKGTLLKVVSLQSTSNGYNLISSGNIEWYTKHATEVMGYVGGKIVVTDADAWVGVEFYDTTKKTYYYHSVALNIKYKGSTEDLKSGVTQLGGIVVETDGKINVIFTSKTGYQYVLPTGNSYIPLLWQLLNYNTPQGQSMAELMSTNHEWIDRDGTYIKPDDSYALTWTQFVATWFFSNKSVFTYYPQYEKLFSVYGTMVPLYSEICPGVAIVSSILTGYFNDLIQQNLDQFASLPNYYDIVNTNYLQISNLVESILSVESELGLDPRLEANKGGFPFSVKYYEFFFFASETGVTRLKQTFNDNKTYKPFAKITWDNFYHDMTTGYALCEAFDKACPFRYVKDNGYGIGQAFKLIISGHWHNSLVAAGLIEKVKVPPELKYFITDSDEYYLEPLHCPDYVQKWLKDNSGPFTTPCPLTACLIAYGSIQEGYDKLNNLLKENISTDLFSRDKMTIQNLWQKYQTLH